MSILDNVRRRGSQNPPIDETRYYGVGTTLIDRKIDSSIFHQTKRIELAVFVEYSVSSDYSPEMIRIAEDRAKQQLVRLVYRDVGEALYAVRQAVMNNDLHGALAYLDALEKTITYDPRSA
jgi:hypothetical protein